MSAIATINKNLFAAEIVYRSSFQEFVLLFPCFCGVGLDLTEAKVYLEFIDVLCILDAFAAGLDHATVPLWLTILTIDR